jgi:hypothetical protein
MAKLNFQMVTSDSLLIRPYSEVYYTLYKAEQILIWVYIGMLWVGSFAILFFIDYKLIEAVV